MNKKKLIFDFLILKKMWFLDEHNAFFGRLKDAQKFLNYWAEHGEFADVGNDYELIHLENSFCRFLEEIK